MVPLSNMNMVVLGQFWQYFRRLWSLVASLNIHITIVRVAGPSYQLKKKTTAIASSAPQSAHIMLGERELLARSHSVFIQIEVGPRLTAAPKTLIKL